MKDVMEDSWVVINYEIEMFLGTQILQKNKVDTNVPDRTLQLFLRNALTESRILHIRVLTEAFLSRGKKDDIKIDNLLPTWRKENIIVHQELEHAYTLRLETGESPKTYIDKLLAHATTKRGGRFNWAPVITRMNPPLLEILRTLPADKCPGLMFLNFIN